MNDATIKPHSERWKAVGACVTGSSHHKNSLPCQDTLKWALIPGGTLVVAVADGAGTAKFAEIGSSRAAQTAIERLSNHFPKASASEAEAIRALKETISEARASLVTESEKRNVPLRDFATTLLLAAIGPGWVAAAQIGDGAVLAGETAETLQVLTRPIAAEYLNETQFLTSETVIEPAQFFFAKSSRKQLAVFSDGLQMLCLKMANATAHPAFFKPLFGFLESATDLGEVEKALAVFLGSPRITNRTDDDLTLFLAIAADQEKGG